MRQPPHALPPQQSPLRGSGGPTETPAALWQSSWPMFLNAGSKGGGLFILDPNLVRKLLGVWRGE